MRIKLFCVFSAAAWSPDGRQLVYAREEELHLASRDGTEIRTWVGRSGAGDSSSSLWEVAVNNGSLEPILPNWKPEWYNCCGNWTSDGKYYVFQSNGNIWIRREKTGFLRSGGNEPVQLTSGRLAAYWTLPSPDGKRLFFARCQARAEFLRFDVGTGQVLPDLAGISGTDLEYAKDGGMIAYISVPAGALLASKPDGSGRIQLVAPPFQAGMPHWSPDDSQIVFTGRSAGQPPRIYVVPSLGGTIRQISHGESGPDGDFDPSWSPACTSVVFSGGVLDAVNHSLHIANLSTGQVSSPPGSQGLWSPRWSPDGRYIAAFFNRRLMLYDVRKQQHIELYNPNSGYPSWSPDSQFIFFQSKDWPFRARIRDRKIDRLASVKGIPRIGWGWLAAVSNDAVMLARDTSIEAIYALDWELP